MKFTLSWLHQHLRTQATVSEICETLNQIGLEVETVETLGKELAPFLTAQIKDIKPHPNAQKLQICEVDGGPSRQNLQIVCGAPNARKGLCVVLAPIGTVIPESSMKIKKGKIRGEVSEGMLCSLEELGLASQSDGIAELPAGTLPGESYADFLGIQDVVIDISITPNRGDALSVRGIARDLSAAGLGTLIPWLSQTVEGTYEAPLTWKIEDKEACPWVLGRAVRGVNNTASPQWLQKRLKSVGLRPINLIVDLTNYFCMDIGRPFHVFDLAKLSGKSLVVRRGKDETFTALNDQEYCVTQDDCVVADDKHVQSLAGIIGADASGVDENTTDIFIECALFNPVMIARSARSHLLSTDASVRFERGVDPALPPSALQALTEMVLKYAGGQASEVVSAGQEPSWQRQARLHFASIKDVASCHVDAQQAVHYLEGLGFEVATQTDHYVDMKVPSWRNDIAQIPYLAPHISLSDKDYQHLVTKVARVDGQRDLLEEILRLYGLDHIAPRLLPPLDDKTVEPLSAKQKERMSLRRLIASRGCVEIVGFSFVAQKLAQFFGALPQHLSLLNPIASDQGQMRPTALINLISAAQENEVRGRRDGAFFELGPCFTAGGQYDVLCGLHYGYTPRYPGLKRRTYNCFDAKGDVESVFQFKHISLDSLRITRDVPPWYHPGRSGCFMTYQGEVLAYFGELHPRIVSHLELETSPAMWEIFIDSLSTPKRKKRGDFSVFQPVVRDFSFLLPEHSEIGALMHAIAQADRHLVDKVELFDIYTGEHVPDGYRSVSIAVTLQPQQKNLKDKDLEKISEKIIAKAEKCQAVLRQ